tara:strand:+ start:91 stop:417 length:327 start_codon:yes stop_codon:yes gene_type:complete
MMTAKKKAPKKAELSLPKSIEAFGISFDIVIRADLEHDNSAHGLAKFKSRQILIDSSLNYSQQVSTLIHEIIEIANEHLELGLEHRVICGLEMVIHQSLISGGLIKTG